MRMQCRCYAYAIQVFLHPKQELPQVRDLGFAIAPGVHALIAVRLNEVQQITHFSEVVWPSGNGVGHISKV